MVNFPVRPPSLQLGFYRRLKEAERYYLLPALLQQVGKMDIGELDDELQKYAQNEKIAYLAKRGLRGEIAYPVPLILTSMPKLLGYYRLLLGFSQKEFYQSPFSRFKSMEQKGILSESNKKLVPKLCQSLIESAWLLINGLPEISEEIIQSLTLLTIGPQFRGSRNNYLGMEANQTVFALIKSFLSENIVDEDDNKLVVNSAAGRMYKIEFAPDPDIAISQILQDGSVRNRIAIEVKGGTDYSDYSQQIR